MLDSLVNITVTPYGVPVLWFMQQARKMANERLDKFRKDKTRVSLKTYSNKLYYGVIIYIDDHFVKLNTHSNIVERFELAEVLFVDEGNRE